MKFKFLFFGLLICACAHADVVINHIGFDDVPVWALQVSAYSPFATCETEEECVMENPAVNNLGSWLVGVTYQPSLVGLHIVPYNPYPRIYR